MKKTYDKRTFAMSQLALNLGETAGERNAANDKPAEIDDIVSYVKTRGALSSDELLRVISALTEEHRKAVRAEIRRETEKAFDESGEALRGRMEEVGNNASVIELPLDYENLFDSDDRAKGVHTDSISDALVLSLHNLGCVDIEYISSITGRNHKDIIIALKGSIYQNPEKWDNCFYKGWETADEYLSGNLRRKYALAKAANEHTGMFSDNLEALERIMPPGVNTDDIYITLGSPWIPTRIIDKFIVHLFGIHAGCEKECFCVKHHPSGEWEIPYKNRFMLDPRSYSTYGTPKIGALYLLEKTLNMKTPVVYDTQVCLTNKSGQRKVVNQSETTLAIEKQRELARLFRDWVWKNEDRRKTLKDIFENKYACYKRRFYDGSFLDFPRLSKSAELYPYQKNAVARIIFNENTLLAHDVGSGKTYVMIAAGMELRRMRLSKKNLYVVPNNIVGQWQKTFLTMYPDANLFVADPKSFTPDNRGDTLEKIRDNDYDGIVMAYSCFDRIPFSKQRMKDSIECREDAIENADFYDDRRASVAEKKKRIKKVRETLDEITLSFAVTFDELGITGLFVDEAHNYKNVSIATKFDKVLGINAKGSKKCNLMMEKVRYVQKNGGKVVFATGTPITNSVTDAYIMQSYLQGSELALLDLESFDAWAGMFSELKADFEIDVDTSKYRLAERFSRFHNLPELSSILSGIADFHSTKKSADLPDFNGYKDCIIEKTPEFADYLNNISSRVDLVRLKLVDRTVDNMLKITTDGRKAALDLRLVDNNKPFTMQSKVYRCAENVFDIYEKYKSEKLTQIIFCDVSTPKKNFNVYDELQRLLLSFGVAPDEIAYIHDATTEKKRSELFEKTRKGEVRILLGSTFKLGIGVNVQDKLIAVHHIDVPWRPADMVQREGRIIRPGNTNKEVFIYRYITDGSFDAYSWQLLETKQNFIAALLEGSVEERNGDDIRDAVLSYAEVKALAIGNPLIKERVEVYNSLIRLKQLQLKTAEIRDRLACELNALPVKISEQRVRIENCDKDVLFYKTQKENIYRARKIEEMNFGEKVVKLEYIEKKREFNEKLYGEIIGHIMESAEKHATDYCGFKVIIPPNTSPDKLCVFLENNGRYQVEIGDTDKGVMQRLYNCLEDLEGRSARLKEKLKEMIDREKYIRAELAKDVDYAERITEIKDKLQKIDKKLGVEDD